MSLPKKSVSFVDPVWEAIQTEGKEILASEPALAGLVYGGILHHKSLDSALAHRISQKLSSGEMTESVINEVCSEAYLNDPELVQAARADIVAVLDRDPACHRSIQPLLFFKGFQAVQAYRVAHWLWMQGRWTWIHEGSFR